MLITLPAFSAAATSTAAPGSYVTDSYVSDYYIVSLKPGWTYPSAPSSGVITFWSSKGGVDCVVGVLTLPAAGVGATLAVIGKSGSLAATWTGTGGSSPTLTATLVVDGQYGQAPFPL